MTDAELVQQTLQGERDAYAELVRRWAGRVTALCHAKVGCMAAAEDLAQDTLLRGYRMLQSLAQPDKFGPWLCRIALNACLNWHKARAHAAVPFSNLGPDQVPATYLAAPTDGEPSERDETLERLRAEVAALPEMYRQVLILYYHQNSTYRDLAELLGVSPATINARLTKARLLLRERLNLCGR